MRESGRARSYRGVELDDQFIPTALEHLDDWTMRLSRTAAEWAERIARQLGLGDSEIRVLRIGALLHAIGRLDLEVYDRTRLPPPTARTPLASYDALSGPSRRVDSPDEADTGCITSAEEALLRRSPALLGELVPESELDRVIDAVVFTGEHYDGGKSPRGLWGEAIPLFARILAVTSRFLALTMGRPGARGPEASLSREEAYDHLCPEAGRRYDPKVLEALGGALGRPSANSGTA